MCVMKKNVPFVIYILSTLFIVTSASPASLKPLEKKNLTTTEILNKKTFGFNKNYDIWDTVDIKNTPQVSTENNNNNNNEDDEENNNNDEQQNFFYQDTLYNENAVKNYTMMERKSKGRR